MGWHRRRVGGQDTHGVVKAPIKSRPSGQLVRIPGTELGRQIRQQGTKPVTQFESGPIPCRGPNQYVCHTVGSLLSWWREDATRATVRIDGRTTTDSVEDHGVARMRPFPVTSQPSRRRTGADNPAADGFAR